MTESTSTSPSRARRIGASVAAAGLLFMTGGLVAWQAPSATAAELFSFDLRGESSGYTFFNDDASGARQLEGGTIPKAQSNLQTGPVGIGLASLAWPGPLAANGGTLLLVLQPGCSAPAPTPLCPLPPEAKQLDYPVRAEARTGQDPPETTYDQVPGTSLKATATAEEVTADALVQDATAETGTFGPTQSHSASRLTDAGGAVEASSSVEDIDLGGVITIESVRSTALATTDGATSDGKASTVVTGMTIGGQPATVGENGVTIGEQGQPANAVANQIAQQALADGGFEIYLSAPQKEVEGATASVTSGSLIITQTSESGTTGIIIGQAKASVTGAPGFDVGGGLVEPAPVDPGGFDSGSGGTGSFDTGAIDTGSFDVPPAAPAEVPVDAGTGDQVAFQPAGVVGGRPVTTAAVILAILGAGLFAIGMRRLSAGVLAGTTAAAVCPLAAGDR